MQHSEDTDVSDENKIHFSEVEASEIISEEESNFIEKVIHQTSIIHIHIQKV